MLIDGKMKRIVIFSVIIGTSSSLFSSQGPIKRDNLNRSLDTIRKSGEVSRDIEVIDKIKKELAKQEVYFSGSNPLGADYLFPGQTGVGLY